MTNLLLLVLSLFVHRTLASVFPCEEVKYRYMGDTFQPYFNYACVITQEGFSNWDQLSKVYLVADKSISLADIARNSTHCLERKGTEPTWTLSAPGIANRLNCDQEFTLILTLADDQPEFIIPQRQPHQYTIQASERVLTVPQTGMWLHTQSCSGEGSLSLSTGAGLGFLDERYDLVTWTCDTIPDWIFTFDTVITLTSDNSLTYTMDSSSGIDSAVTVSPGSNVTVISSCKAVDLQNLAGTNHCAMIKIGENEPNDVFVNMQIELDINEYGSVALQHSKGGPLTRFHNGKHTDQFNTGYFEVRYLPLTVFGMDVYTNDDYVYMEISIGGEPSTAKPATISPDDPEGPQDQGPYCNCAVDKFGAPSDWAYNDIWLDVVVILDTSEAMGAASLEEAGALVESFLSDGDNDFLITDPRANFYTRIGVIAMAETATVLYNLNMTKADKVQGKVAVKKGLKEIDVVSAFNAAVDMLNNDLVSNPERANTRQVIYYMTDSDPKTNLDTLNLFKSTGVIIVNNFLQEGESQKAGLTKLASDGYFSANSNYMQGLQAFCKANCFCSSGKDAYGGADPAIKASGGCYHAAPVGVPFAKAKTTCANEGGILATIHDDAKGRFVQQVMTRTSSKSDYYWIGYDKSDDGIWRWEDESTDAYTNWGAGEPSTAAVAKCAYVDRTTARLSWGAGNCQLGFPYVCQSAPCSVGNKNC